MCVHESSGWDTAVFMHSCGSECSTGTGNTFGQKGVSLSCIMRDQTITYFYVNSHVSVHINWQIVIICGKSTGWHKMLSSHDLLTPPVKLALQLLTTLPCQQLFLTLVRKIQFNELPLSTVFGKSWNIHCNIKGSEIHIKHVRTVFNVVKWC